jgi:hypothetical protein
MVGVDPPSDSRLLSDTDVADSWIDAKRVWMQGGFYLTLIAITVAVATNLDIIQSNHAILLMSIAVFAIMRMNLQSISQAKEKLDLIAISVGHPWHDSESVGDTTVYLFNESQWVGLGADVRVAYTKDPIIEQTVLRNGDSEGEILVRWSGDIDLQIVSIINMAQALANAQDRDEDAIDSFESAREREDSSEGILEREWMDTEEGSIDYEPGAILRRFKRSKDSENDPE